MEKEMSETIDDFLTGFSIPSRRVSEIHVEVYDTVADNWNLTWDVMREDLTRSGLMQK